MSGETAQRPATLTAEAASALPMPLHRIVNNSVVCDAPPLSICRLHCATDCGSEEWPCGGWDEDDEPTAKHEMADGGECQVALFIEASGDLWDCFEDELDRPEGDPPDGVIECEWAGYYYVWRYTEANANADPHTCRYDDEVSVYGNGPGTARSGDLCIDCLEPKP